jgi:hypothetical protein
MRSAEIRACESITLNKLNNIMIRSIFLLIAFVAVADSLLSPLTIGLHLAIARGPLGINPSRATVKQCPTISLDSLDPEQCTSIQGGTTKTTAALYASERPPAPLLGGNDLWCHQPQRGTDHHASSQHH